MYHTDTVKKYTFNKFSRYDKRNTLQGIRTEPHISGNVTVKLEDVFLLLLAANNFLVLHIRYYDF